MLVEVRFGCEYGNFIEYCIHWHTGTHIQSDHQTLFQDSLSDYGRLLELWSEVARAMEGEEEDPQGRQWVKRTFATVRVMCSYLFALHENATRSRAPPPSTGLLVGPAEHDTCKDRAAFFSINGWTLRGWLAVQRFLSDTSAVSDKNLESELGERILQLEGDLHAAVEASLVRKEIENVTGTENGKEDGGKSEGPKPFFLPPYAAAGFKPYSTMIEKTRRHEPGT